MEDDQDQAPESLLPYDAWTEDAMRQVMVRALAYVGEHGLPGAHHFYLTFRTDHPQVTVPARLRAQYPQEMTIVLQHQFWDLAVDEAAGVVSVGLSFGGVPSTLRIPLSAITAFADPHVRFGLRLKTEPALAEARPDSQPAPTPALDAPAGADREEEPRPDAAQAEAPQVVSLDAFRRRTPPKDS